MAVAKLIVLYPHPTDVEQFDRGYAEHVQVLRERFHLPAPGQSHSILRFVDTFRGWPTFYQMATLTFSSLSDLEQTVGSPKFREMARGSERLSTGGDPVVLVGVE